MLILVKKWLLQLIFSMAKELNGQNSSKQNLLFLPTPLPSAPFNAPWKTLLQLLLVFHFSPSLFQFSTSIEIA